MKILLTGCAGFIGSNVCRILIERGDSVTGVDNLDDSYDVRMKRWRLDRLAHPRLSLHEADIADITSLRPLFESGPPFDAVINLGAKAGIRESIEDPHGFYESNTTGTLNLPRALQRVGRSQVRALLHFQRLRRRHAETLPGGRRYQPPHLSIRGVEEGC